MAKKGGSRSRGGVEEEGQWVGLEEPVAKEEEPVGKGLLPVGKVMWLVKGTGLTRKVVEKGVLSMHYCCPIVYISSVRLRSVSMVTK